MTEWKPAYPQLSFEGGRPTDVDGEWWPPKVELEAWERNDKGEHRIKATRTYVLDAELSR